MEFGMAKQSWPAYGAALWSLVFAAFHVVWAMGWYVGLDAETARRAFDATWKLVYDIVIAGMCVLGVLLALAFVQPWGQKVPLRVITLVGWCATGLLLLRGGGSVIQIIYFTLRGRLAVIFHPMALWEVWFYLGATLFCVSFWRFQRRLPTGVSKRPA
jgi:hypothetical protein